MITAIGLQGPMVDLLCIAILAARVCQSTVHVSQVQTDAVVAIRFSFYSLHLVSFLALIAMAALAWGTPNTAMPAARAEILAAGG